jgi:hypothetical protein
MAASQDMRRSADFQLLGRSLHTKIGESAHMTGLTIRFLTTADAPAVGVLLTASHRDYPAFRLEFPDPSIRARVLLPF